MVIRLYAPLASFTVPGRQGADVSRDSFFVAHFEGEWRLLPSASFISYRPQQVLTWDADLPADRAGIASREPGPWSPWRSRRGGRPRSCARWRAASGTGG